MATQIVENVLKEAQKQNAQRVTEVHLVIGEMTFLGIEQIRFSYNFLTENTIMNDSKLIVEEKKGKIECHNCGYIGTLQLKDDPAFHLPVPTLQCPKCGKAAKIVEGKECIIKSIKMLKKRKTSENNTNS